MNTLGERIKETRESIPMTQEELGKAIGVTGVTIMRYEKGQREPSLDQLQKLAEVLNVAPEYLVGWNTGSLLNLLRQNQGFSQEELAAKSGLSVHEIQQAEGQNGGLSVAALDSILNALGMPLDKTSAAFQEMLEVETKIQESEKALRQEEYEIRDAKLRIAFAKLNARAQEIAIERLEELAKIPEYQNPDFPDNFEFPDDFLSDVAEPDEEP
ncbi:MAG: helix-turn-helix transcriptional regulator [Oscillospiraceae bacterium]|nr:helix-turn-helix transcriptional regulator [Oscillospiraceae bacterium]